MALKTGLAQYDNVGTIFNTSTGDSIRKLEGKILSCRVLDIDETGESTNGVIIAEILDDIKLKGNNIIPEVYPLDPNTKNYPLVNQTVVVIPLANRGFQNSYNKLTFYYINPINLWNNQQSNPIPSPQQDIVANTQTKGYIQVETTNNPNKPSQGNNTTFTPGKYFNENIIANPTYPYEGDYIIDGRFGNSIRLGNTVPNGTTFVNNNWSSGSQTIIGDPITIITNKKHTEQPSFNSITEDINQDKSSIYFTSTQIIPLIPASENYNSYSAAPIKISRYGSDQILINSGRLVFNSSVDSILLSSKQSINLNSISSVNIDTNTTIINSKEVFLGGKEATEPILKGDTTVFLLEQLCLSLENLCLALTFQASAPNGGPLFATNQAAASTKSVVEGIRNQLVETKSKISKTL
jgi:hypothetical protein